MFDSMLLQKNAEFNATEFGEFYGNIGKLNHQIKQSQILALAVAKTETPTIFQHYFNYTYRF